MRFWDSSAVVPLCVAEPRSAKARDARLRDAASREGFDALPAGD